MKQRGTKRSIEIEANRHEVGICHLMGKELRNRFEIRIGVEAATPGSLLRASYKPKIFLDEKGLSLERLKMPF